MNQNREEAVAIAAETMLGDLMQLVIGELRAMPDVWQKLSEARQGDVIERVEKQCRDAVRQCIQIIATRGHTAIPGTLDSATVKDGIKAVVKIALTDPHRHDLIDATGRSVIVIVADAAEFSGGSGEVKPDPQQPEFNMGRATIIEGDFKQITDEADAE